MTMAPGGLGAQKSVDSDAALAAVTERESRLFRFFVLFVDV